MPVKGRGAEMVATKQVALACARLFDIGNP